MHVPFFPVDRVRMPARREGRRPGTRLRWVWPVILLLAFVTLSACGPSGAASDPDDEPTPPAPTDVTVAYRVGAAVVTWSDASGGEASFRVYREAVAGGSAQRQALEPIADVPAGSSRYVDEDVTPGQAYRYAVAAVTASETSGAVPQKGDAAAIPASQVTFAVGTFAYHDADGLDRLGTRIAVAWATVIDGEIAYQVAAPGGEVVRDGVIDDLERRFYTTSSAVPTSGVYELTVRSGDGSEVTQEVEVDAGTVLPAPTGIDVVEATADRVTVAWDGYDPDVALWASLNEPESGASVGTVDAESTGVTFEADELDAALEPGGSYRLFIHGRDGDGATPQPWDPPGQENGLNVRGPTFTIEEPSP